MQNIIKNKLISSVVLLALGVLLIVAKENVPVTIVRVIGAVLLCGAVVRTVVHLRTPKEDRVPVSLLIVAVAAIFGVVFLVAAKPIINALNILFGILMILNALLDLVIAVRLPSGKKLDTVLALIALALGIVIIIAPNAFTRFMTVIIGGALVYAAVVSIVTALLARKTAKSNLLN